MRAPKTVEALEEFGRVRLSHSFFMRDFLYSEIANAYGMQNILGRIAFRSAYRSPTVNKVGNENGHPDSERSPSLIQCDQHS